MLSETFVPVPVLILGLRPPASGKKNGCHRVQRATPFYCTIMMARPHLSTRKSSCSHGQGIPSNCESSPLAQAVLMFATRAYLHNADSTLLRNHKQILMRELHQQLSSIHMCTRTALQVEQADMHKTLDHAQMLASWPSVRPALT